VANHRLVIATLILSMLTACSAMWVVATTDPNQKLADARDLLWHQDRPIPAERLIKEALAIFEKRGDDLGIARANAAYAEFLRSAVLDRHTHRYPDRPSRMRSAIAYYERAVPVFRAHEDHADLPNALVYLGMLYESEGEKEAACKSFSESLTSWKEYIRVNPGARMNRLGEFNSFEEAIAFLKKRATCEQ
jgi:tetratricopeptide (TPR) repeat protein